MNDARRTFSELCLIAAAVLLAAGTLLARNVCADRTYGVVTYINTGSASGALVRVTPCLYGWPCHFMATGGFIKRQDGSEFEVWNGWLQGARIEAFWPWPFAADVAVVVVLAGLCGLAMDEWRALAKPRFSLAALLAATAAGAVLLAVAPKSYRFVEFLIQVATYVVVGTAVVGTLPRLARVITHWRRSSDAARDVEPRQMMMELPW